MPETYELVEDWYVRLHAARVEGALERRTRGAHFAEAHHWEVVRVLQRHAQFASVLRARHLAERLGRHAVCEHNTHTYMYMY